MSKLTLKPVTYFDMADIYTYEVDNRPLYNISENIDIINTELSNLGFYQELYANPETEPAGGFSSLTCVMYGQNGRLFPIDISQPLTTIDYTKYPIYLVLEKITASYYKCISFSASLSLSSLFNKFLADSIGKAVKIGPGGSLVDEIYFDLYYSDYNYQNIIVGKVLTPMSIAFGGNQVATLGDNRFLAKNRDESTTGLTTRIIQNDINNTAFKSSLVNSSLSSYPFVEYINQSSTAYGITPGKTPVYFTSIPLFVTDGNFNTPLLETVLNEVHFSAPLVSSENHTDAKYKTAGVNISSLLSFSQSFLLHSKPLSSNLEELSQTISTSLLFDSQNTSGLNVFFDSSLVSFGITGGSSSLTGVLSATNTSGIYFGTSDANASIYHVTNTTEATSTFVEDSNSFSMSSLVDGSALVLKASGGTNTLFGIANDGPIVLSSTIGVFYHKSPILGYEITNKLYVDSAVLAASNTANTKISLSGSTQDIPVTGSLYFDTKGSDEPSIVLQFDTLIRSQIKSSYPVEFKALATSDFQVVRGETPNTSGDPKDLTNRAFVESFVSEAIGGAIGSNFVSRIAADTITATKTFNSSAQIITNNSIPLVLHPPVGQTEVSISTDAEVINFAPTGSSVTITSSSTQDSDSNTTLTTKDYVLQKIDDIASGKVGEMIFGIWYSQNVTTKTTLTQFNDWYYGTRGTIPDQHSANFLTYFTLTQNGALQYTGTDPALFSVSVQDARITGLGPAFPGGIFRTQTAIVLTTGGSTYTIARNIHQDDTSGDSINSLVGTSCSSMVYLQQNDILYILSEQSEVVSTSIARIR